MSNQTVTTDTLDPKLLLNALLSFKKGDFATRLPTEWTGVAGKIADACAWGASEHGCDVDVRIEELFRGYEVPKDAAALGLAEAGLRASGLEPQRVAIGGGSDANVFRRDGLDCILLSNGTADVHTSNEMVPARSLDKMLEVCEAIVAEAGAAAA